MRLSTLAELPPEVREANRKAAGAMIKDQRYHFPDGATTIPMERRAKGSRDGGKPIEFEYAMYIGWRPEQEEHMFLAEVGEERYFAPMYLDLVGDNPTCIPCDGLQLV